MKIVIVAVSLVLVFAFGLSYKEPIAEHKKGNNTDVQWWKNNRKNLPWTK